MSTTPCTVEEHVAEVVAAAQRAYGDGHRHGVLAGHRAGSDQGYLAGYDDGIRSQLAFKLGARDGYMDGWQDGRADRAEQEDGGQNE